MICSQRVLGDSTSCILAQLLGSRWLLISFNVHHKTEAQQSWRTHTFRPYRLRLSDSEATIYNLTSHFRLEIATVLLVLWCCPATLRGWEVAQNPTPWHWHQGHIGWPWHRHQGLGDRDTDTTGWHWHQGVKSPEPLSIDFDPGCDFRSCRLKSKIKKSSIILCGYKRRN